jgi:hypothetical protein
MGEIAMRLEDFEKALSTHDWYFNMSDDHSVYMRGDRAARQLNDELIALTGLGFGKEAQELFNKYRPW